MNRVLKFIVLPLACFGLGWQTNQAGLDADTLGLMALDLDDFDGDTPIVEVLPQIGISLESIEASIWQDGPIPAPKQIGRLLAGMSCFLDTTQPEMAALAGMSTNRYAQLERGQRAITITDIQNLYAGLNNGIAKEDVVTARFANSVPVMFSLAYTLSR